MALPNYWELYYAYQNLKARQEALEQALATWEKEKEKLKIGEGTIPDVAQAQEQRDTFQIELTIAENEVLAAENHLRTLMGLPGWDGRRIVALDAPTRAALPVDWNTAVAQSLSRRPELLAQQMAVRAAELEYSQAQNNLLPEVNFVANYTIIGLDNQFDQSINQMLNNKYGNWTMGFSYEQPIGRRPARAAVRQARAVLSRQQALARKRQNTILHELQAAYQGLIAAQQTLKQYQQRLETARIQLDAREEFYRLGEMSVDLLVRAQAAYVTAQREEVLGVVRYNQAITRWEYAKGTILDRSNVVLAEEIPPPEGKKSPQAAPHEQTVKPLPSPRKKTTEEPQRFPPNMVIPEPNGYD